jgi:hypothetical protein
MRSTIKTPLRRLTRASPLKPASQLQQFTLQSAESLVRESDFRPILNIFARNTVVRFGRIVNAVSVPRMSAIREIDFRQ